MEYNDDAPLKALKKEVHKAAMFNVYSMVHTGFVVEHTNTQSWHYDLCRGTVTDTLSVCLVLHLVKDADVHVYSSLELGIKKLWLVSLTVSFAVL